MPIRPTPRPEVKPSSACVSRASDCRKHIAAATCTTTCTAHAPHVHCTRTARALHTHRTCTEHAPHVAGRASPRRTALPPRSLVLALARGGSDIPDPAWHRRHEARESQRVEDAFLLVPQLAALASRGGLSRRMAALRTGDEPLSRSGPHGRLRSGRAARPPRPIPRLAPPGASSGRPRCSRS